MKKRRKSEDDAAVVVGDTLTVSIAATVIAIHEDDNAVTVKTQEGHMLRVDGSQILSVQYDERWRSPATRRVQ